MSEEKEKWPGPEGLIPVTSHRADDANIINRRYLDRITLEMRVIDAEKADLHTHIFNKTYNSPIMMPAFSHLNKVGKEGRMPMEEYALAAKELNVLNWVGMEEDETFEKIMACGADTVRIIKPFADHDRILRQIDCAKACGAVAAGMDIDHVPGVNGDYDNVDGYPMEPVRFSDLQEYVSYAGIPFVAKGVLSVQDAVKAADAGCAAIVVSHHHGRMPFGMPPAEILPEIRKALQGRDIAVFADCGIDSGYDAYKLLALGADAVSTGRGILKELLAEGKDGVIRKMNRLNEQLAMTMLYTGVRDTASFDQSVLHII